MPDAIRRDGERQPCQRGREAGDARLAGRGLGHALERRDRRGGRKPCSEGDGHGPCEQVAVDDHPQPARDDAPQQQVPRIQEDPHRHEVHGTAEPLRVSSVAPDPERRRDDGGGDAGENPTPRPAEALRSAAWPRRTSSASWPEWPT
jgi:hypothetical protein